MNEIAFNLVKGSLSRRREAACIPPSEPTQADIHDLFQERITPATILPPLQPLFTMFDVPCFYRGELVANCGKAKSGKTFFLSIVMAACLSKKALALHRNFLDKPDEQQEPSENAPQASEPQPLKVLWIDTEQSQQSTQEILKNRVMPLAGTEALDDSLFYAFNLRGLGYQKRSELVEVAIKTICPDICIIDGVKDLLTDINDAVQATFITEKLMALAKEKNCCIVCVLHQNKSEQDRNMRGSIGTELTNKAFEVFQCEMIEESETFKVSQTFSRKRKMNMNLYYQVNEQGLPEACANYQEQPRDRHGRWVSTRTVPEIDPNVDLKQLFTMAMEGRSQRPYEVLMGVALKSCGVKDAPTYYLYLNKAIEKGIVRKVDHPETKKTWVVLNGNDLPF